MSVRPLDLVLFGATGFVGNLTADYLSAHLPAGARWALAGRQEDKLRRTRDRIAAANPGAPVPALIRADAADPDALRDLAERARVVITTVGPYLEHGEPLVAACAAAGTDYLDLCGEPEFIDRMYLAHHATAVRTGARIVHSCGFDSMPHDLGVLFTVGHLPDAVPLTIRGVVRGDFAISGGTFHSALGQFSRPRERRRALERRREVEPRPVGRRVRAKADPPHRDPDLGVWLLPMTMVDPMVVARSAAARPDYGPDFTYSHYAGFAHRATMAGAIAGAAALIGVARVPPLRRLIGAAIPRGHGPSDARRARSWFTVDLIGEGGGRKVHTRVAGGDPGYTDTATMLSEAAICLAFDDNPTTAGQVTTAVAMGENLVRRLMAAGISFALLWSSDSDRPT